MTEYSLKSTISFKDGISFPENEEIEIPEIFADPQFVEANRKNLIALNPEVKAADIERQLNHIIVRDNAYNRAMDAFSKLFDFNIDKEELESFKKKFEDAIKAQNPKAKPAEKYIDTISQNSIKKTLMYKIIVEKYGVNVTDDDAKQSLEEYYEKTNKPIRQILDNKEEFAKIKAQLREKKILDILCFSPEAKIYKIKITAPHS